MTDTNNISDADINAIVASIISDLHLENFTLDSTDTLSSTAPIEDIQLKKNPESVLVEESTSRFSDAIWYKKVREQTVILAGLGGIGSYVAYLLSRVKVNKLILYDDDTISLVNMAGQLYSKAQIGQPKVAAMNQIAQDFSDYFAVETLNEKYTEDSMVGPIMICGFDNMAARNLFFHKWKSYVDTLTEDEKSKALFIDGRLNAEEFQIFSISGDNTYAMDIYERQQEACQLLERIVAGEVKPFVFRAQPPILLPAILTTTDTEHMKRIRTRAEEWEQRDGVINVSTFAGYYASDKYEAGASVVVITDDNAELAVAASKDVADLFWEVKEDFMYPMTPIEKAIEEAQSIEGSYGFMDECDDPFGGGTCDGTYILQKILDAGITSGGVSAIRDPEIVAKAWDVGVGGIVTGKLGGKIDDMHGDPIDINAKVLMLSDQEIPIFFDDPTTLQSVGRMAVIEERGIKIVVCELKGGFEGIDILGILGYDVKDMKALVLKGSSGAIQNVFGDRIARYTIVESLGITNPDVTKIGDFKKLRRPIWPLDTDVTMRYK